MYWGVRLFTGVIILVVIVLLAVGINDSLLLNNYQDMPKIELTDLKNGDIFLGFNDFSRFDSRLQAQIFFTAHSLVARRHFTHLGIIYIDPRYERDDPRAYYVWNISCVPWNKPAIMKYEWAQLGSKLMPLAAMCALYQFCCITPIKHGLGDNRMQTLIADHDETHKKMARSAQQYLYRGMKSVLDPQKPDTPGDHLFCTDIAERIMREAKVFRAKKTVVTARDLYIDASKPSTSLEFGPDQGLLPTCRLYIPKEHAVGRDVCRLMEEFGFNREFENDLLWET